MDARILQKHAPLDLVDAGRATGLGTLFFPITYVSAGGLTAALSCCSTTSVSLRALSPAHTRLSFFSWWLVVHTDSLVGTTGAPITSAESPRGG